MLRFETILCPVDFSEYSTLALKYAIQLATQYESRLVVYHSIAPPVIVPVFPDRLQGGPSAIVSREAVVEDYLARIIPANLPVVKRVEILPPVQGILKAAEDEHADLIVMGTHGHTGYEALLLGSVTHRILHKSTIPVLAVCKPAKRFREGAEPVSMRKILCAVEPKQQVSLKRLHLALSLARSYVATVVFFQVRESVEQESTLEELKDLLQSDKEEWCKVEFLSARGRAVEEILKAAETEEADLVVLGHHIRIPGALDMLGSVGLRVIPQSPCPVLVVRD